MRKIGKLLKKLILILMIIYAVVTFFYQQNILDTYKTNSKELDEQIATANREQEELNKTKKNVNSDEYIEKMAREKLDMYLPDEEVYINNEQ